VDDVVETIIRLMDCREAIGQVINVGGSEEISIKSLADLIKQMTDSQSEIQFLPYETVYTKDFEDMQRRVPSVEKLYDLIGWKPNTSLADMLWKVIEYHQSR
jgi:UDP-glucose 4-epimerase